MAFRESFLWPLCVKNSPIEIKSVLLLTVLGRIQVVSSGKGQKSSNLRKQVSIASFDQSYESPIWAHALLGLGYGCSLLSALE